MFVEVRWGAPSRSIPFDSLSLAEDTFNFFGKSMSMRMPIWVMVGMMLFAPRHTEADTWTTLGYPDSDSTQITGIDGDNIVGTYSPAIGTGISHGFLYDGSDWTSLRCPWGPDKTQIHGIDGDNIVGTYRDSDHLIHGFLYDGTDWVTIDYPGATFTGVEDIDGDKIVGTYSLLSRGYGFVYEIPGCPPADLTGDCYVDLVDLAVLANEWEGEPNVPLLYDMVSQWLTE